LVAISCQLVHEGNKVGFDLNLSEESRNAAKALFDAVESHSKGVNEDNGDDWVEDDDEEISEGMVVDEVEDAVEDLEEDKDKDKDAVSKDEDDEDNEDEDDDEDEDQDQDEDEDDDEDGDEDEDEDESESEFSTMPKMKMEPNTNINSMLKMHWRTLNAARTEERTGLVAETGERQMSARMQKTIQKEPV
jgi:hypothetical protein